MEFNELKELVQNECFAHLKVPEKLRPELGRPHADKLKGSKHSNMNEGFSADNGVWRLAFAFDPCRQGILLICGDKPGGREKRFYKELIKKADTRFDKHLSNIKK